MIHIIHATPAQLIGRTCSHLHPFFDFGQYARNSHLIGLKFSPEVHHDRSIDVTSMRTPSFGPMPHEPIFGATRICSYPEERDLLIRGSHQG